MNTTIETLPSGKTIVRKLGEDGRLERETHRYGAIICLSHTYFDTGEQHQSYMVRGKPCSADAYEVARTDFPDMPKADRTLDLRAQAKNVTDEEHQAWRKALSTHNADPAAGDRLDQFCKEVLKGAEVEEGRAWLSRKNWTVGDLSNAKSRQALRDLFAAGARNVYLCRTESNKPDKLVAGELVIEMPVEDGERKSVLILCDTLSRRHGYAGVFDDMQHYVYVKMD